jgi:hypothetical protein
MIGDIEEAWEMPYLLDKGSFPSEKKASQPR